MSNGTYVLWNTMPPLKRTFRVMEKFHDILINEKAGYKTDQFKSILYFITYIIAIMYYLLKDADNARYSVCAHCNVFIYKNR